MRENEAISVLADEALTDYGIVVHDSSRSVFLNAKNNEDSFNDTDDKVQEEQIVGGGRKQETQDPKLDHF